MNFPALIIGVLSLVLFIQSLFSLYLMLYSWEHPERLEASSGPRAFLPAQLSFTVLLPARHEEAVIGETIHRVWSANYPTPLLEIVVVCHADDTGTIAEAQRAIHAIGSDLVRVETFNSLPINKPHGLNVAFARTANEVVTIFDAEDDIHPDIFNVINTVMVQEHTGIVQAGVQLMNFRDHWFAIHNCLEYFFWFKSRLHFHAQVGMIPLGGNTIFIRRDLLNRVGGWDETCLTEDAEIGLRLSVLGERVRVVYDAPHVTREETPHNVDSFMRQRTRWHQGFLQVLRKGTWRQLRDPRQQLLAVYTLAYPLYQAVLVLLWPLIVAGTVWLKLPVLVSIISLLPLYSLLFQALITVVGAFMFTREYGFKFPLLMPLSMTITFLPFQWLQGISALRAVYRELRNQTNWEKTVHLGAHRQVKIALPVPFEQLLDDVSAHLDIEQASVMVLDPATNTYRILSSRGLPADVVASARLSIGEGIVGWVAEARRPIIIGANLEGLPGELANRLRQPGLCSSIILPIEQAGSGLAILSIASTVPTLGEEALHWLNSHIRSMLTPTPANIEEHKRLSAGLGIVLGD